MASGGWDDAFDLPDPSGSHREQTSSWDGAFEQEAPQAAGDAAHAEEQLSLPVSVSVPVRRGPGRPKGSSGTACQRRQWAKRAAADAALDHDDDAESQSQLSELTGIERARAAKAAKAEERKQKQNDSASMLVHQSENASGSSSSTTLSMLSSDSKVWNCMLALAAEEDTSQVQRVSWNLLVDTTEMCVVLSFWM